MGGGYLRKDIMDAVMAALRPLGRQAGGYVRHIAADHSGLSPEDMRKAAVQPPALFISHSSSMFADGQYLRVTETATFEVVAVCRTGGEVDTGGLLDDVRGILCGNGLGLAVTPLKLVREATLSKDREITVATAEYVTRYSLPLDAQAQNM